MTTKVLAPFKFSDNDIKAKVVYDMKLLIRMGVSFDYLYNKLVESGNHISGECPELTKDLCLEGKSYDWLAVTCDDVKMLLRIYGTHFTVFTCFEKSYDSWTDKHYGAFTYNVNYRKITKDDEVDGIPKPKDLDEDYIADYYMDSLYNNPFSVFNTQLEKLLEIIRKRELITLWSNLSFPRPKCVKVECVYYGNESVESYDKLIFCAEELSSKHMQLFAENEMFEALKNIKIGDAFNGYMHKGTVTYVRDDLGEDNYYHRVGLEIDEKFHDVYSLTRWDLDAVFPVKKKALKAIDKP